MGLLVGSVILILPLLVVALKGDPLSVGLWYYLGVPLCIVGSAALARPGQWFLVGVAVTLSLSFLVYQWIQISVFGARPEGLLALGHGFSMPGVFVTGLAASVVARLRGWKDRMHLFTIGFGASAAGFMIAQMIVCITVFYCGPLTLWSLVRLFGSCGNYSLGCR